jgi:hypothetical protein
MDKIPIHEAIGNEFAALLANLLTQVELTEVKRRNGLGTSIGCASHDFCDANMVMLPAFEVICECEFDLHNDDHVALFNLAWSYAKNKHLA